jgi:hypothetical protein
MVARKINSATLNETNEAITNNDTFAMNLLNRNYFRKKS